VLAGARTVVLRRLASRRVATLEMSRVKPAKMLVWRELPMTSERITAACAEAGGVVELEEEEGGGWGLGVLAFMMGCWSREGCLAVEGLVKKGRSWAEAGTRMTAEVTR